jgi:hypothetical protein
MNLKTNNNVGVITMKSSQDLLSSVLKTTQMGQIGIRSVLKCNVTGRMRTALQDQISEYDKIESEAHMLAESSLEELNPAIQKMSDMMTRTMLCGSNVNSKAAAMMIRGNTRGMIKSLKNLNQYDHSDQKVEALANKLLTCEENNIKQMQGFV